MINSGRAFDRLVNFSDAVVAVAITLLALTISDIRWTQEQYPTVWAVMAEHASVLITFAFTFAVVGYFWLVHNRIFNRMAGYDAQVFWLNLLWLLLIAFLPWPSSLYGEGIGIAGSEWEGGEGFGGAGMLYWGTLALIGMCGGLIAERTRRRPELLEPGMRATASHSMRGFVLGAVFLCIGVTSLFAPGFASWMPVIIIPISSYLRIREQRLEAAHEAQPVLY